eukprot:9708158-Alexandrium_andersonii.AAC.1
MSASLVGSEMCIRDRGAFIQWPKAHRSAKFQLPEAEHTYTILLHAVLGRIIQLEAVVRISRHTRGATRPHSGGHEDLDARA